MRSSPGVFQTFRSLSRVYENTHLDILKQAIFLNDLHYLKESA